VFLLFDSDEAGLKATFRAGDALLRAGLHPAVVTIPPGEDPDTLVRQQGASGLRQYVDQAVDVLERKLQMLDERAFFGDIDKTRQALDKLLPTLRAAADPALRDIYVARVAARTGVRRETLESEMLRRPRGTRAAPVAPMPTTPGAPGVSPRAGARASRTPVMGAERTLVLLMVKSRDLIERVSERVGPEDFADPAFRAIFEALVTDPELRAPPQAMDPVAAKRLEELLAGSEELEHPGRMLDDTLERLELDAIQRESTELDRQLAQTSDAEERARLVRQKEELVERRRRTGVDHSHWARRVRALGTDERHR
jgi:DNA primase